MPRAVVAVGQTTLTKVFFSVGMTLDGFIAPEGMDLPHADDPSYNNWMGQWIALQKWVFEQEFFRRNLKLGDGGTRGRDNELLETTFNRTGVSIMGKRMFDGGERVSPEEACNCRLEASRAGIPRRGRATWAR